MILNTIYYIVIVICLIISFVINGYYLFKLNWLYALMALSPISLILAINGRMIEIFLALPMPAWFSLTILNYLILNLGLIKLTKLIYQHFNRILTNLKKYPNQSNN